MPAVLRCEGTSSFTFGDIPIGVGIGIGIGIGIEDALAGARGAIFHAVSQVYPVLAAGCHFTLFVGAVLARARDA